MKTRILLLTVLLLSASVASAAVYKWVDEQGNVHYGDLPPGDKPAEPVKLPGLSTYRNRAVPQAAPQQPAATDGDAAFDGYTTVEIVQPESGSAVRANDQRVPVAVALEPALQDGHSVQVLLDGEPVGEPYAGIAMTLEGVFRGQHRLQVRILDAAGKPVGESATITFTLRQVSALINPSPPGQVPNPGPPPTPPPSPGSPGGATSL